MPFDESGPPKIFCTACGTPHHEDCYQENGGCTVFGCSRAPADDPKLQVSQNDLRAVNLPAPHAPAAQMYAPVQSAPLPQSRPSHYGSGPLGLSQAAAPAATAAAPASQSVQPPPPPGTYFYPQPPAPAPAASYAPPAASYAPPSVTQGQLPKSRTTYIVLGIFLGWLGVHNFYAGYTGKGAGQLCLSLLTLGYLSIVSWVWAIIEVCVVVKDSKGVPFS
jgi:TM2 domain-containing membrane protein YozV